MPRRISLSSPIAIVPLFRMLPLVAAIALALAAAGAALANEPIAEMKTVTVVAQRDQDAYLARQSASASKLDLSLKETPQSVSVITRARMDDFKLDNVNAVLANTTGVTVEQVETDRTYYSARGFDITNFQYDGVGLPMVFGNVLGDLDTALYERIDIVRGANGLTASTGNPSASVNFIRKRPTGQRQASVALTAGSWNARRIEADVTTPLNASGSVSGRAVLVRSEADSYLDRYSKAKIVAYAIVQARLGSNTLFSLGHTHQDNDVAGGMWGALPLYYTDGSATSFPVNASTSADWSAWDTTNNVSFAELTHGLSNGWLLNATATRSRINSRAKLLYLYGTPERATGEGLFSYPSMYASNGVQSALDVHATGQFTLAGRQHELVLGINASRSRQDDLSHYGRGIGTALSAQASLDGSYPEPLFDARTDGSHFEDKRNSVYATARFFLSDAAKVLAGFNSTRARSTGLAYGDSKLRNARKATPYVGVTYDVTRTINAYASYSEIFNPQSETDEGGQTLDPVMGSNAELGLKGEFAGGKLMLTAALFRARQNNAAELEGYNGAKAYYSGIDAEAKGVELELAGQLAPNWFASIGMTSLSIDDPDGTAVRTYVPRKLLRLSTSYRPSALPGLKIGANLQWQGDTERDQGDDVFTRQPAYAVLGLMARYDINTKLSLALNLNNVTDKKYLTSLYWSQGYHAAPRNASATLNWAY